MPNTLPLYLRNLLTQVVRVVRHRVWKAPAATMETVEGTVACAADGRSAIDVR